MIGFSIEFKRWYLVIRGPKGRIYTAFGFAKRMPVFTSIGTISIDDTYSAIIDDTYSAILADEWNEDDDLIEDYGNK